MFTLIGTALGGLFRLAPEFLKWLDRKDERKHEREMLDRQIAADRLRYDASQKIEETRGANALGLVEVQALIEATKAQGQQTGVKWVDGLNALMRPTLTFWWCIVLETGVLICTYLALLQAGHTSVQAILAIWGPEEKAIVASIISFWFVDRALRYMKRG